MNTVSDGCSVRFGTVMVGGWVGGIGMGRWSCWSGWVGHDDDTETWVAAGAAAGRSCRLMTKNFK